MILVQLELRFLRELREFIRWLRIRARGLSALSADGLTAVCVWVYVREGGDGEDVFGVLALGPKPLSPRAPLVTY